MIDAAIARVLLEASLRVCFVSAAVAGVLRLARVQSSSVRHAAWTSVVVAMLLMPLLPYALPSFELPGRSRVAATMASVPDELPYVGDVDLTATLGDRAVADPAAARGPAARPEAGSSSPDPDYGPNIFRANCLLGLSALRAGNRAESVKYLTAATDVPASLHFGLGTQGSRYQYLANTC